MNKQMVANVIQQATDHPGCSHGQLMLAKFIRSCLNYDDEVNMKELLYRIDPDQIKAVLEYSQSGDAFRELVKSINPALLQPA